MNFVVILSSLVIVHKLHIQAVDVRTSKTTAVPPRQFPRVGMFYSVWHTPGCQAQEKVEELGGIPLTIEDVIRSNHTLKIDDIYWKYGSNITTHMYWQTKPLSGYYCIYRRRPGERGVVPDCKNISDTLERHAKLFTDAGIDFILVGLTNLPNMSSTADMYYYRPLEVLCEEWLKLRNRGISTPDIAAWVPLPPGSSSWRTAYKNVYMNSSYDDLIWKHQGRKVIHVKAKGPLDSNSIKELESSGITVVNNWANLPRSKYEQDGYWRMMGPCIGPHGNYSTTVVGSGCDPGVTRNSPLGSMVTAVRSFQLSYASTPWHAPGTLSGLTFKEQMKTAFKARPDYLFISGWNEQLASPQPNHYKPSKINTIWSMGLQNSVKHPSWFTHFQTNPLFVDNYGEEFQRNFEPDIFTGERYYQLLQSCVKVFRSGATSCNDTREECCDIAASDQYINVFSFYNPGTDDNIVTTSLTERNQLLATGWKELCSYFSPGDSIICSDTSHTDQTDSQFILYSSPGSNRIPLFRCQNLKTQKHFLSLSPSCEDQKDEGLLGYVATVITSENPKSLMRCDFDTGRFVHSLDHNCPPEAKSEKLFGYVR